MPSEAGEKELAGANCALYWAQILKSLVVCFPCDQLSNAEILWLGDMNWKILPKN